MAQKLLAIHIPFDAHHDVIDAVIANAFGRSSSSFSPDGLVYHYHDLEIVGLDAVRHVMTFRQMTIHALQHLLQEHGAFVRESIFQFNTDLGLLEDRSE